MMFNEAEADAEVARILAKHNKEIIERRKKMPLLKEDGKVFEVVEFTEVTREELAQRIVDAEAELIHAKELLASYLELTKPEEPVQPVTETPPADTPTEDSIATDVPQAPISPQPASAENKVNVPMPAQPPVPAPEPPRAPISLQ